MTKRFWQVSSYAARCWLPVPCRRIIPWPAYDLKKVERATGVVQKFAFTNPHGALHIAIKNAQGEAKRGS